MRSCAIALATLALLATEARAEINVADSIEWQTSDSDVVVRGFITDLVPHTNTQGATWYDATFQITETVKGPAKKSIHVGLRTWGKPDDWRAKKTDLLLFLVAPGRTDDKELAAMPFVLRPNRGTGEAAFVLGTTVAYLSSFGTATTPTDVLAAVRAAARSPATVSARIDVPLGSAAGKALWSGSSVWMFVPVDPALEARAVAWATDRSARRRVEAIEILSHWKSTANIAIVTKLLADPEAMVHTDAKGVSEKRYAVRAAAHATLTKWGVAHKAPVVSEPAKP